MIGIKLRSPSAGRGKLPNRLVIIAEVHQGPRRWCSPSCADGQCQSEPGGWRAPKRKTGYWEYLDCTVQIFGAPWNGCRQPGQERQSLPVIELIISNYATVPLCLVFCSLGLCWEGESTRGIWGNDVSPSHLLLWLMTLKHKHENTSVCNLTKLTQTHVESSEGGRLAYDKTGGAQRDQTSTKTSQFLPHYVCDGWMDGLALR